MFHRAVSFNQNIGNWVIDSVTSMEGMFFDAKAFKKNLGWCVDNDVSLNNAFWETKCESTSCGVTQGNCPTQSPSAMPSLTPTTSPLPTPQPTTAVPSAAPTPVPVPRPTIHTVMNDNNIWTARDAWLADPAAAEAFYGHITTWETGGVTDMSYLFCVSWCS